MGTRADFYVGRGKDAEWIGSIAFNGFPDRQGNAIKFGLHDCMTERDYRDTVIVMGNAVKYFTYPDRGWPWPWDDSALTDYVYTWDGMVLVSRGETWHSFTEVFEMLERYDELDAMDEEDERYEDPWDFVDRFWENGEPAEWPDMSARKNVAFGDRSGMIFLTGPK